MKILLLSIFTTITLGNTNYDLVNTVWKFEVSKNCNDTLEFLKNNRVLEYSCEKDYHFTGSYKINKNILIITEKDNSFDGQKPEFYRLRYLIKNSTLTFLSNEVLKNNKWEMVKIHSLPTDKPLVFQKQNS